MLGSRPSAADTLGLRIEWGGAARRWVGSVSISEGTLSGARALGIEADEPGSMWFDRGYLALLQRSPRLYDGVDLFVDAPADAKLLMQLAPAEDPTQLRQFEIPLSQLLKEAQDDAYTQELDDRGNRLTARRTPGDALRVSFARDSLVFAPGEKCAFSIENHLLPLTAGTETQISVQLTLPGGQKETLAGHRVRAGQTTALHVDDAVMPEREGVYELLVTAAYEPDWQEAVLRRPREWKQPVTVARRRIQLLVVGETPPAATTTAPAKLARVGDDIEPNSPRWQQRLASLAKLPDAIKKIPGIGSPPLGNGQMRIVRHRLGELAQLSPSGLSPDVSWEAYTLSIERPGLPHVLEVEYPSDLPQTLGISILEPDAAGALLPVGLDSGIDRAEQMISDSAEPRWLVHRVVFWPRTKRPLVLLSNLRDDAPAAYGRLRVRGGWQQLPKTFTNWQWPQPQRMLAAYLDRPLFPENFSAGGAVSKWSSRTLDDWHTFYQGGTRLVEYLNYGGYNALMIAALADGSTIYPSRLLEPTPRYDTGVFLAAGQDPLRKDVLEMLLRLFDREELQLIPTLEFAAPLPELEALLRQGGADVAAIECIGADGRPWRQVHPPQRGLAPHYNLLDPRVQEAMLRVIRELTGRYAPRHRSFAGLGVRLSATGYAQLPGPQWCLDDATIARFEQDQGIDVPGEGTERFARRAEFFRHPENRDKWLRWRAEQLGRFYRRMDAELAAVRPDARLYLIGAGTTDGAEMGDALLPSLPRKTSITGTLLRAGIDVQQFRTAAGEGVRGPILLRPEPIVATGSLGARAVPLELAQMSDVDDAFRDLAAPGSLFYHRPQEVRIASFDRKSPFDPTYTSLVVHPVPSARQNRRRFVHSLATLDSQVMVDGGWMLPLGQEDSVQDLVAAYRLLPAVPFRDADDRGGAESSQPVTFRYATHQGQTYIYAVNDAPFSTSARVRIGAPPDAELWESTRPDSFGPLSVDAQGAYWTVDLQPYDLVVGVLSRPGATLARPEVSFDEQVAAACQAKIRDLTARAAALRDPPLPLTLLGNPDFELPTVDGNPMPGWLAVGQGPTAATLDAQMRHGGQASARLTNTSGVTSLVSLPFAPPKTGRLSMSVWLRVADAARQPPLWLALDGKRHGETYYRYAPVGQVAQVAAASGPDANRGVTLGEQWAEYILKVDDLPLDGLSDLRVRFDLMGPGEVWIDDVKLYDMDFSDNETEVRELSNLITLAHIRLKNQQIGDCLRLLEGYWPRFLEENVALPLEEPDDLPVVHTPQNPAEEQVPKTGLLRRVRGLLPEPWRF